MPFIVKNTTFPNVLDLLIPHSCRGCGRTGEALCDCCKNYITKNHVNFCPNCKASNPTGNCPNCPHLPPTFIVGSRDELIGQLIYDFKFSSTRTLAKSLAEVLDSSLPHIKGAVSIIPLPTINRHIRERGLDHTFLIAKQLAKLHPEWQVEPLLTRANHTVQVGASKTTRKTQATKAYLLNQKIPINPSTTYLLLDDIWTTGSSMQAALSILQKTEAKKIVISILAVSRFNH